MSRGKRGARREEEREIGLESPWKENGLRTERERDLGRVNLANQTGVGYLTGSDP